MTSKSVINGEVDAPGVLAEADAPIGRYRWLICLFLFVVTVNNFMDRQILSIAAPVIAAEYQLSNADIATIGTAFLISYTFGQLFAGVFIDWIGARIGFTLAVLAWTLTAIATTLSQGVRSFSVFRFVLGAAESVNWPGGVKVCAEWFPPKELATAVGIYQSGSAVGAMIAPAIGAFLIEHFGWKTAFVLVALPGLFWIPLWLVFYHPVESSPRLQEPERQYILTNRVRSRAAGAPGTPWRAFLRKRTVWGIALARFFEEPAGWFYFMWLPLYLKNDHSVSLLTIGILLVIPFLAFDAGKVGGGWISSVLLKRGWSLDWARKAVMLGSAVCLMASIPSALMDTALGFVLLVSVATFGHGSWTTTVHTIPGDIVPPARVATVYGITACCGGMGAILFMQLTGKVVDLTGSFTVPLFIAGILPMMGFAVFSLLVPRLTPLDDVN